MIDETLQGPAGSRPGGASNARGALLLLITGIGLGVLHNGLGLEGKRPWGLPWIAEDRLQSMPTVSAARAAAADYTTDINDPLAIPAPAAAGLPEIPAAGRPVQIELGAVKLFVDARAAILIDAREPEEFAAGHIPGAVNLPYDTAVSDPTLIENLDTRGLPLITYCGGGSCEMSLSLADELFYSGHERVAVYMGGFPEWVQAGYPVAGGSDALIQALKSRLSHPWIVAAAQVGIGAVFVFAGLAKLGDPRSFAEQIHNFRLVPVPTENLIAMTLPWIELLCGLALIVRQHLGAASRLILAMMVLFTVAVGLAVARGLDIECGCFGTADASRVGLTKLLENGGMILMAWVATFKPSGGR